MSEQYTQAQVEQMLLLMQQMQQLTRDLRQSNDTHDQIPPPPHWCQPQMPTVPPPPPIRPSLPAKPVTIILMPSVQGQKASCLVRLEPSIPSHVASLTAAPVVAANLHAPIEDSDSCSWGSSSVSSAASSTTPEAQFAADSEPHLPSEADDASSRSTSDLSPSQLSPSHLSSSALPSPPPSKFPSYESLASIDTLRDFNTAPQPMQFSSSDTESMSGDRPDAEPPPQDSGSCSDGSSCCCFSSSDWSRDD